jgi:hypothetical protein
VWSQVLQPRQRSTTASHVIVFVTTAAAAVNEPATVKRAPLTVTV